VGRLYKLGWLLFVLLLSAAGLFTVARAQDGGPNQAALVVQFDDGRLESRCISFEEDQIRGAELLTRSGLEMIVDPASSMGVTVCQIEGLGCVPPGEHCFCQCMGGGDCSYWNYFYWDPSGGDWIYSPLGAALRTVRNGSLEAWVWGDGQPPETDLTFESICALPTPTPLPTREAPTAAPTAVTAIASLTPTSAPVAEPSPTPPPPTATARPQPTAEPEQGASSGQSSASYWLFGLMIVVLAAIGLFVRFRRA
jgi:hypothetical protein